MADAKGIFSLTMNEYGCTRVKLREVLEQRGITRNKLSELTGVRYSTINRYFKGEQIEKVDLDILSRICFVLNCRVEDLLEYVEPER